MYKKYNFPLNIFCILEKTKGIIFSSKYLVPNHFIIFLSPKWLFLLNQILKNEYFFNNSYLVEASCCDTLKYAPVNSTISAFFKKKRILIYYTYYFYRLKMRFTIFTSYNNNETIRSIDSIFKNANWVEREFGEMFDIKFNNKRDMRKLLLDYSKNEAPMLKNFDVSGLNDVFYNFFDEQVNFIKNDVVEL